MRLTLVRAASRRLPESYHNMPKRFIDRHTSFIERRTANLPQFEKKVFRYKTRAYYDEWRPWQFEFEKLNAESVKTRKIYVEPIREWNVFRGDRVEILVGPDKGKHGIVNHIIKERNWVFLHGLNLKREEKMLEKNRPTMLICVEQPLLVNREVKLVDPSDLMPTEIDWKYDDNNNRVRVSKRTGVVIPIPMAAYETRDYVLPERYVEQAKDTKPEDVEKVTYFPQAKTFEMDICDQMGIKDDRVPYPMYWY